MGEMSNEDEIKCTQNIYEKELWAKLITNYAGKNGAKARHRKV